MKLCSICHRKCSDEFIEKHHLIPKQKGGKHSGVISVCVDCGNQLHNLFTNKQLQKDYNTLEKIINNSSVQKWIKWIRKKIIFV